MIGDETLGGLSVQAAQRALEMAQVRPEDVDLVLLCLFFSQKKKNLPFLDNTVVVALKWKLFLLF